MTTPLGAGLAWLAAQRPAMERLLAELVDKNSFTENVGGTTWVAGHWLAALTELTQGQVTGRLVPAVQPGFGAHLVAETAAAAGDAAAATLLIGHHDTVFPPGSFEGYRSDGERAYGPGTLDMKGGLVVIAYAIAALVRGGGLGGMKLRIVSVSDEEVGTPDGKRLLVDAARGARAALVFESGRKGDLVITERKGTGGVIVRARGKAAHAGNNHADGANAIWAIARFVDRAQRLTDYHRGITLNVGKIAGGISKNTVPEAAECGVDLRFVDPPDGEAIVRALAEAAAEAAREVPGTALELSGGVSRLAMRRTDASSALSAAYGVHARAAGLDYGEAKLLGGGSDANTLAALGVPAIDGLGPRGFGFHTKDEQIELATLVQKADALARYLASEASSPSGADAG